MVFGKYTIKEVVKMKELQGNDYDDVIRCIMKPKGIENLINENI